MTKKDYELIAEVIKLNTDSQNKDYLHKGDFLLDICGKLEQDNPRFDRNKFLEACGIETMSINGKIITPKQRDWIDQNIPL